jgi:hypothetical protein
VILPLAGEDEIRLVARLRARLRRDAQSVAGERSEHLRPETVSDLVNNHAIEMNGDRHNVFLNLNYIFKFPLPIKKLPQPRHLVIHDLPLRFQLRVENAIAIFVANDGHWSLAERVDVNAKPVA